MSQISKEAVRPGLTLPRLTGTKWSFRTYQAKIEAPTGVTMSVDPSVITFKKGGRQTKTFKVTFKAMQRVQGGYTFGSLTWLDDCTHSVRIPIAVRTIIQEFFADTS